MAKSKVAKTPKTESLLVELLTEELPPKSLRRLSEALGQYLYDYLSDAGFLTSAEYQIYATPRRLAAAFPAVRHVQEDRDSFRKGPSVKVGLDKDGNPTDALLGFSRAIGSTIEQLEKRTDGKTEFFGRIVHVKGESIDAKLSEIISLALEHLPVSKVMRWGTGNAQFVRPIHGVVMMHGSRVVPGKVVGLESGNRTRGHRFMGAGEIQLGGADEYEKKLLDEGKVLADFGKRKTEIDQQLQAEAKKQNASLDEYQVLLDEVAALVEHPSVYVGEFDKAFLEVPQECLI